ncbi:indole-3-acetic acid-induced protein ARG2 [Momordica charantia]|uniref:Indole-3-acetic acid-induced protein ARG2 n=1 Tax=Momordica charantia TaxID=3673 RepID=A0A6J1CT29_MOMCH|nr:indole-3-acetic acid-induced protein ARG2 [Momordica charantia]
MARSVSSVKVLSALVADGFSSALSRRGYAAASQGVSSSAAKAAGVNLLKKSGEDRVGSSEKVSWVPDPVTGYYRPENRTDEIDVAELRSILLKNKN